MSLLNENLEVFLAASEGKSLSETAKQLSMTQSAVTKKIRKLEDSLNVELFDRSKRPIKLTREGEILKHHSLLVKQTLESTTFTRFLELAPSKACPRVFCLSLFAACEMRPQKSTAPRAYPNHSFMRLNAVKLILFL